MQADIKEQILSIINLRLLTILLPAVVLSILAGWIMYALGYPAMVYGEVLLILKVLNTSNTRKNLGSFTGFC